MYDVPLAGISPGGLGLSGLVYWSIKKPILVYLSPSNLLLNALMLVASTAPWSNWFHYNSVRKKVSSTVPRAPNFN